MKIFHDSSHDMTWARTRVLGDSSESPITSRVVTFDGDENWERALNDFFSSHADVMIVFLRYEICINKANRKRDRNKSGERKIET